MRSSLRRVWRIPRLLGALAIGISSMVNTTAAAPQDNGKDYIVVLHDGQSAPAVAREHANAHALSVVHVFEAALTGYAGRLPAGRLAALQQDPRVAFVAEDLPVMALAQPVPTGVKRIGGHVSSTSAGDGTGSVNVGVAVIDTGIEVTHPDLNVAGGKNCSTGKSYNDGNGHGTHVAGTIGAWDNASGVVGVAPGAPLYAVRVLNNAGSGSTSSVVCGIDWVTANAAQLGIKVANLSLGGSGADDGNCGNSNKDAMHRAICGSVAKGVTYVVAAGNSGVNLASSTPAAYNEVLTVTAMADFNGLPGGGAAASCRSDVDDTYADFSNYATPGSDDADHTIAAPGVCIHSTWKGGGYATISGTSMASPHVAGSAALCIAGPCAGMTPPQVMAKLRADAAARLATDGFLGDPHRPVSGRAYGHLIYAGGY